MPATGTVQVVLLAPGAGTGSRVPVLACAEALRPGAEVRVVEVDSDAEVDAALAEVLGPPRGAAAGAYGAVVGSAARLVVAGGDGPLRGVVRRLVRRVQPRGGDRTGLADSRTVPDLPTVGVLPLDPANRAGTGSAPDLAARLGLPRAPAEVAAAVLGGRERRLDLLRTDAGSVTLHAALLGGADASGQLVPWRAVVNVDDAVLSDGDEALYACAVANAGRVEPLPGLALVGGADPADGLVEVAVAVPVGRRRPRVEVRRGRGRAVTVAPVLPEPAAGSATGVASVDDGVAGMLRRRRTWWVEHEAWGVYVP